MTDNISKFVKSPDGGKASEWTPREALAYAMTQLDQYDSVVIMFGNTETSDTYGITAVPNALVRDGLLASGLRGNWPSNS